MTELDIELLVAGLEQIPRDGLERLKAHIEADKPILLNGSIYDSDNDVG